jgi:hypothetical protein
MIAEVRPCIGEPRYTRPRANVWEFAGTARVIARVAPCAPCRGPTDNEPPLDFFVATHPGLVRLLRSEYCKVSAFQRTNGRERHGEMDITCRAFERNRRGNILSRLVRHDFGGRARLRLTEFRVYGGRNPFSLAAVALESLLFGSYRLSGYLVSFKSSPRSEATPRSSARGGYLTSIGCGSPFLNANHFFALPRLTPFHVSLKHGVAGTC